jgi:hypothetical protein
LQGLFLEPTLFSKEDGSLANDCRIINVLRPNCINRLMSARVIDAAYRAQLLGA